MWWDGYWMDDELWSTNGFISYTNSNSVMMEIVEKDKWKNEMERLIELIEEWLWMVIEIGVFWFGMIECE